MKALTVQQPWAWAIFHGKDIENRTQLWKYRGPLAIHAGARWSDRGAVSPLVRAAWRDDTEYDEPLNMGLFVYGVIIGTVDLVDCHPAAGCCKPWGEASYLEYGGRERRHITHLVCENPQLLCDPIPCRGALGLWIPPADITDQLQAVTNAWKG